MMNKKKYFKHLNKIRKRYKGLEKEIVKAHPYWIDVYGIYEWDDVWTPIEFNVWQSIRFVGIPPFYPQYPIDKYVVDFADPVNEIVLEVDSKKWHSTKKAKQRDKKRQKKIEKLGYRVFRIPSKYTYHDRPYYAEPDGSIKDDYKWKQYQKSVEYLLLQIRIAYCSSNIMATAKAFEFLENYEMFLSN